MMSLTAIRSVDSRLKPSNVRHSVFSRLPMTWSTSSIAAKRAGSICAAQPVTTIFAWRRSRRAFLIACRAWRTASAVTAQVLTITASPNPAPFACSRMTSDS
jgi:hypothetical protein